uniref:Uncharacterized protein n=1 Tax=Volvariella volvacea TaxID=36659 RepID=A0A5H2Q7X5_9AGAR|nr:hypothetical protein [Volvariella volvacea]AYD91360.1 hypothetical protein [Volvariella volvacea]
MQQQGKSEARQQLAFPSAAQNSIDLEITNNYLGCVTWLARQGLASQDRSGLGFAPVGSLQTNWLPLIRSNPNNEVGIAKLRLASALALATQLRSYAATQLRSYAATQRVGLPLLAEQEWFGLLCVPSNSCCKATGANHTITTA